MSNSLVDSISFLNARFLLGAASMIIYVVDLHWFLEQDIAQVVIFE